MSRSRSLRWHILVPLAGITTVTAALTLLVLRALALQEHPSIVFSSPAHLPEGRSFLVTLGGLLGLSMVIIAASAWWLIRRHVLIPIAVIEQTMLRRARGDTDACAPARLAGEVGDLARTYNKMLASLRDSERHRALSEEKFSKAFQAAAVIMGISTLKEGRYIDVNQAFLDGLGFRREEVIGRTSTELDLFCHPADRQAALRKFETEGRLRNQELEFKTKTGELRHGLFSLETVVMGGEVCLLVAIADITERKRSEQALQEYRRQLEQQVEERTTALRESERIHRTLFEHMAQGVVYLDADGRVTMANPAAERILGLTLARMQAPDAMQSLCNAIHEDGSLFVEQEHPSIAAMRTGRPILGVVMGVQNPESGGRRWILVDAVAEYRPGETRPYQVFTTFTDITERKRIEAQLFQAQKLESVGRLAAGVAHDFNNCMYCVLGFSELILNDLPADSTHRPYLVQIQEAARQAAEVTKQLLAFSRQQMLLARPVDINALIRDHQNMLRRLIGEDIHVELDLLQGAAIAVADPTQFHQVLMNLCINARDAMPHGGTLTIRTNTLGHVAPPPDVGRKAGAFVTMVVEDTGVGMSAATLDHIFEPFFTTKESSKGTGLGLPVVHGIVRQHGGWIEAESREGHGARFIVYFPRADTGDAAPPAEPSIPLIQGGHEGILLVEDDAHVRYVTVNRLRRLGYRVVEAESIQQARERFHAAPQAIHLLLSDVVLPDGTGTTLAEELTTLNPTLKVVMTTGYTDEKSSPQDILSHNWAFIRKPYMMPEIAALLQSLLPPSSAVSGNA
jgi:PAS domain S-box-containing protein